MKTIFHWLLTGLDTSKEQTIHFDFLCDVASPSLTFSETFEIVKKKI